MKRYKMWIGGEWVETQGGATRRLVDPSNGEAFAVVPAAGAGDARKAIREARAAFDGGPWRSMAEADRARILLAAAQLVRASADSLARLEALNCGKPLAEATAEVEAAASCFEERPEPGGAFLRELPSLSGGLAAIDVTEPAGVVGSFVPPSHPLLMTSDRVAAALRAGCATIVKPSDLTPVTALELARLLEKAGLPAGVVNVITGDRAGCEETLRGDRGVDWIDDAWPVESDRPSGAPERAPGEGAGGIRAAHVPAVASATVVLADANLDAAVSGSIRAAFENQGQARCAASRLLVHEAVHDRFVAALVAEVKRIRLGNPLDRATGMGPLLSAERRDRVLSFIKLGRKEGARLACGGGPPKETALGRGLYVEPTVFTHVDPAMRIAKEPAMGPVLAIVRFRDEEESLAIANGPGPFPAAAVWTAGFEMGVAMMRRLRARVLWLNDYGTAKSEVLLGGLAPREIRAGAMITVRRLFLRVGKHLTSGGRAS